MKAPLETVERIIRRYLTTDPKQASDIIHDIKAEIQAEEELGEEKPPAQKKQFVILVSDPNGNITADVELVGWVVQIPEEESVLGTEDRIFRAAWDFNASKKGRKHPVSTVGEAIEAVGSKFFKEAGVTIKTKEPVAVIQTNNLIPKEIAE